MTPTSQFQRGDVVVHPRRPEWGPGVVDHAAAGGDSRGGQRLVVRFENYGRVTIHTAVAPLVCLQDKEPVTPMSTTRTYASSGQGWLAALASGLDKHELHRLPEALTDPFASLGRRLEATLDSYKLSTEARSLIDWAVAQTGLGDPLTKYTRQELEQGFSRFARDRDLHLKDLIKQIRMQGQSHLFTEAQRKASTPAARSALTRYIRA
jgi:hypothetical protein